MFIHQRAQRSVFIRLSGSFNFTVCSLQICPESICETLHAAGLLLSSWTLTELQRARDKNRRGEQQEREQESSWRPTRQMETSSTHQSYNSNQKPSRYFRTVNRDHFCLEFKLKQDRFDRHFQRQELFPEAFQELTNFTDFELKNSGFNFDSVPPKMCSGCRNVFEKLYEIVANLLHWTSLILWQWVTFWCRQAEIEAMYKSRLWWDSNHQPLSHFSCV